MARRQKYKFAKKEYAKKGKISACIAIASAVLFVLAVLISFGFRGQAGMYIGGLGMMAMLLSIFGFFLGLKGFSEKRCSHVLCTVGMAGNGLIMVVFLLLISLGAA